MAEEKAKEIKEAKEAKEAKETKPTTKPSAAKPSGKKIKVVSKKRRQVNPFTREVFDVNQPILAVNDSWLQCQLKAGILHKA